MSFILLMLGVLIVDAVLRTHHGPLHYPPPHFRMGLCPAVWTKFLFEIVQFLISFSWAELICIGIHFLLRNPYA